MSLLIGASSRHPNTSLDTSFQHLMTGGASNPLGGAGTGPLRARRTFTSGAPPSNWANTPAASDIPLHGVDLSWWSCKGSVTTMAAGGYAAALNGLITTFPAQQAGIWTHHHEPENNGFTPAQFRAAQKAFHYHIVTNRGTKDIRTAIVVETRTSDPQGPYDLEDWVPVYQAGDTIPAGYSAGDPAFDLWGWDFYDWDTSGIYKREWGPVSGGNQLGLTGYIDRIVSIIQSYPGGGGFTRADLVWAIGEIATKKPNAVADDWFADIVTNAAADTSICEAICWFDNTGGFGDSYMHPSVQAWIRANGAEFGNGGPATVEDTLTFPYAVDGPTVVEDTLTFPYAVDGEDPVASGEFVGWGIPL
jgi:hypothetical protein